MNINYIKKELEKNRLINKIIYFDEINSTQIYAKDNVKNINNGTVILTKNQTSGIGTHGREWLSEKSKNITFTIVLKPNKKVSDFEFITIKLAEYIIKVINEIYNIKADIKIPNDVIINDKKVAGILTETIVKGDIVTDLYIGIGLNVNQEKFSEELKDIATSLLIESKNVIEVEEIICKLLLEIDKNIC